MLGSELAIMQTFKEKSVRSFNKQFHENVTILTKGNRMEETVEKRTE